jgi:hypothetical protein
MSNLNLNELLQQIEALKRDNEALKLKGKTTTNGLKVSTKGAVSLYGMGRFPVTLYASQWEMLLAKAEEIRNFISSNSASLAKREE